MNGKFALTGLAVAAALLPGWAQAQDAIRAQPLVPGQAPAVRAQPLTPGQAPGESSAVRAMPIVPSGTVAEPSLQSAPGDPLFEFANLLYQRERYADAVQKYTQFLNVSSESTNAPVAWFRLAVSYQKLDRPDEARTCYDTIVREFPDSRYAPSAAFVLAPQVFNAGQFEDSIIYWETAIKGLEDPQQILQCRYFLARCYHELDRLEEALPVYEQVSTAEGGGDFSERAALELAWLAMGREDKEEALRRFNGIRQNSKNPDYVIEATTQEALLNLEMGNTDAANTLFEQLLDTDDPDLRQRAQLALLFQAWENREYQQVLALFSKYPMDFSGDAQTGLEVTMLVAHSNRNLEKYAEALTLYGSVSNAAPETRMGAEAGYYALQCRYLIGDDTLPEAVQRYVDRQAAVDPDSEYIDLAFLMAGDVLFEQAQTLEGDTPEQKALKKETWAAAAQSFEQITPEQVPERYRNVLLYRLGWSYAEVGMLVEAQDYLSRFISQAPEDPLVASVLIKRATILHEQGDVDRARADYQALADTYPDSEFAEFALQQVASIYASQHKRMEMIEAYGILLERFPETDVRDQAWFFIGGGHFELQQYAEAIEPLEKARELNPERWGQGASLRLVVSQFHVDDLDKLLEETNHFLTSEYTWSDSVAVPIYFKLGRDLYDAGKPDDALPYLVLASKPETPAETPPDIWEKLSAIYWEREDWANTIEALDHYLAHPHHPTEEAAARMKMARSHRELEQREEARKLAADVLQLIPNGRTNAEARILLGDLKQDEGKPDEAAQYYVIVANLFEDPVMTPQALQRLIHCLEETGDSSRAQEYREALEADYPNYTGE